MYILDSSIRAILSDRGLESNECGISKKPYNNLNIAYHVGDNPSDVTQNRTLVVQKYFVDFKQTIESNLLHFKDSMKKSKNDKTLLYLNQIHSNHIIAIRKDKARFYTPELSQTKNIQSFQCEIAQNLRQINLGNFDGIICDNPMFIGLIMVADCNAILLYNSLESSSDCKSVFALLHAGRAGVQKKILTNAINILKQDFNIKTQNLKAFISPSIRQCCYEIGNLASEFDPKYIHKNRLDMIAMLLDEMKENEILESNITISPSCSCCDTQYFSHRRGIKNNTKTGRFGIFACINNKI